MIFSMWNYRWLLFLFVLKGCVKSSWPTTDSSSIDLLGIFPDVLNRSKVGEISYHCLSMFKCAIILSHRYNIKFAGEYLGWKTLESGGDGMNLLRNSCLIMSSSNIVGIVGPIYSSECRLMGPFGKKVGIPVISYGATAPEFSDRNIYSGFYRTVPSDNTAALALAELFVKYNWTSCIIVYQNDAFGSGGVKAITDRFNDYNLSVSNTILFDIVTENIRGNLKTLLMSSSTRIVILWASPKYASLIIQTALDNDVLGPKFTWILSSKSPLNDFDKQWYDELTGMITVEPVVGNLVNGFYNKNLLNEAFNIWQEYEPESFPGPDSVDNYALFAFDATWTLIQSLNILCSNSSSCLSFVNTSFCFDRYFRNSDLYYNIINNIQYIGVSGIIEYNSNSNDRINGSYYVAKNLQRSSGSISYIPVLVWSQYHGWESITSSDIILWPGHSLTPPTGYASVKDLKIRIAVTETAPFTMLTKIVDDSGEIKQKLIGYVPDLIEILENRMGFISNITIVVNKTFNEIINLVSNDVYDMFIAQTTITSMRREKVLFSNSIFDNSLRIIVRKESKSNIDIFFYLRSFSLDLWITLLISVVYAAFLICLLEYKHNQALQNKSLISIIAMSLWYSVGTIVGYGVDFYVTTAAGRLLTLALYILSLVLVATYTANLASELTISKTKDIISGIDDIKNGKIPFNRIGILIGSALEDFYLREVSGGNRNFYPLKTKDQIYESLLNNLIDLSIMDAGVVEYITNNVFCNLTLTGTDFGKNSFGIVFQKKWLYQQDFDVNILSLRETGVFDNLRSKWFQRNLCSQSSDLSTNALTIHSMAGLFLTFAIITILTILLFLFKHRCFIKNHLFKFIFKKSVPTTTTSLESPGGLSSTSKSTNFSSIYF